MLFTVHFTMLKLSIFTTGAELSHWDRYLHLYRHKSHWDIYINMYVKYGQAL